MSRHRERTAETKTELLLRRRAEEVPPGAQNVHPIFAREAFGATLIDVDGKEYLDFAGGIGVLNAGHRAPRVVAALREQIDKYLHTCFHVVMYEPYVELAAQLNRLTPGDFPKKTFFANSGAEAVENAVKIARHYTGRSKVIAFGDAFHGRTNTALALTSKVAPYKKGFDVDDSRVVRLPFPDRYRSAYSGGEPDPDCGSACLAAFEDLFKKYVDPEEVAAVIVEPVLGEGGFIVPPPDFLPGLADVCRARGMLLVADEVQTGFGRTGRWYACEHFGVEPDIILSAKSLADGMPLAAVTGRADVLDVVQVGGLGGTYGGNPLACVAALATIETIREDGLLARAEAIGGRMLTAFRALQTESPLVGDVRGLGAMVAMELVTDRATRAPAGQETAKLVQVARDKGLLLMPAGTYGNVIRILSPLVVTDEEVERGIRILSEALRTVGAEAA